MGPHDVPKERISNARSAGRPPGPPRDVLELGDLPTPTAQPGKVLVQVKASGITPPPPEATAVMQP